MEVELKEQKSKPVLVPTELSLICKKMSTINTNRSSNPLEHFPCLTKVGIMIKWLLQINPDNSKWLFTQLLNFGLFDKELKKAIVSAKESSLLIKADAMKKTIWINAGGFVLLAFVRKEPNGKAATSFVA